MSTFRLPIHPIVLIFLFLGLVCSLPANAKSKSKPKPPEDHRILVTAVDVAQQQITVIFKLSGLTQDYIVDGLTQVTIGNNGGSIKDIKVGQEVFAYVERGDGHALDSITVDVADPAPSVPTK